MLKVLSIGDLVEPGSYRFLNGFRRVVNLSDRKRVVTLAVPGVDRGPLNVILEGLDPGSVERVRIEPGTLEVDGVRVEFGQDALYDSALPPALKGGAGFRRNLIVFGALLRALAPRESLAYLLDRARMRAIESEFERRLAEHTLNCVRDTILWNRRRGISRLSGCGIGLTPSGDDFIVGFLLGLGVLESLGYMDWTGEREKVLEWTGLRDIMSTAFLRCAARGHAFESMHELVAALDLGDDVTVHLATERLLNIGATSGADTGVGFFITVREGIAGRLKGCARTDSLGPAVNEGTSLWS
jgi:hypothetical protein